MLPLNTVSFVKVVVISSMHISIQTLVKKIKNHKIIEVSVTVSLLFEKNVKSNTQ